jgi:hypothetical protein
LQRIEHTVTEAKLGGVGPGHTVQKIGRSRAAIHFMVANANIQRFLGLVLVISLVVGVYLTLQEIDRAMGEGALFRLLFKIAPDKPRSTEV